MANHETETETPPEKREERRIDQPEQPGEERQAGDDRDRDPKMPDKEPRKGEEIEEDDDDIQE